MKGTVLITDQLSHIGTRVTCPAAVIIKNESILLGLRNYTPDKWKAISVWTTPGGRCEEGETVEIALRREVKEEIGVENLRILDFIGEIPGAKEGDIVPVFLCDTDEEPRLMEPEKFSEWKWIPDLSDPLPPCSSNFLGILFRPVHRPQFSWGSRTGFLLPAKRRWNL